MEKMKAKILQSLTLCVTVLTMIPAAYSAPQAEATSQSTSADVTALKSQLVEQQKQIDQLKLALEEQKKLIEQNLKAGVAGDKARPDFALPRDKALGEVASTTPIIPPAPPVAPALSATPSISGAPMGNAAQVNGAEPSPLQLKIGDAYITPVGFMDFTSVYRSSTNGAGIGTNFGNIPYGNVFGNNLSEERLSMQNSRIGFRVDALVHDAHVIGYFEGDFLGNNPTNVAVTSNSNTFRSRLYWVDLRKGNWELLGGQTWSLMTPGRTGISPLPSNVFYTQDMDVNYQAGLVWGRIPELRLVGHFADDKVSFALAFDQQEQYVGGSGGSGVVVFPSNLVATYPGGELNNQTNTLSTPNVFPDTIAKLAFDPTSKFHAEVGGVVREFRVWNPNTLQHFTSAGGGGFVNSNLELFPGFRLIENLYWSDGGGRYIFGLAPDLAANSNGALSLIHSGSTVDGFEFTHGNSLFFAYYGGVYIGKDVIQDTTGKTPALVGWGYPGSANGQNRAIQEATFGFNQTIWKDAKYGALNFIGQYSYLTRNPWYVPNNGSPEDAHLNMVFLDLRYTLPGSAPTMGH
jgi:hypothetical protein